MNGLKRNLAPLITQLLAEFPIVAILGARQTGKTTLAKTLCPDWRYFDLQKPSDYDRIQHDIEFFFQQYPEHIIIDEAQDLPALFPVLRGVIDEARSQKGRFLITGSSNPNLKSKISESLAGRIATVELGTLKANEHYKQPLSEFYSLFQQPLDRKYLPTSVATPLSLTQMQTHWLRGGYPEPVLATSPDFFQKWMSFYHDTYLNRDIASLFPKLNQLAYRRFLNTLASLSGTVINKSDLARVIEVSEKTIREYIDIATGTFLWRPLSSYENSAQKSLVKMPKGYIRDSGLLHYLQNIETLDALYESPTVGHSFEAFVIEEIHKGLEASISGKWSTYYYRTRNGAEIDLILEGNFGTLPIEIKYGSKVERRKLRSLSDFIKDNKLPFGILINQSQQIEWLTPDILQLPAGWI